MRKLITVCAVVMFFGASYARANWITLSVPVEWGSNTFAGGISGSNIIGHYTSANGIQHGFLYNGGNYTTLDKSGATWTSPNGISVNNIVGSYSENGIQHGFLYNGGNYTTLDKSGATWTNPTGINDNNIVGSYSSSSQTYGFLYNSVTEVWKPINKTGEQVTNPLSISGNNIVGNYYKEDNIQHGFLYNSVTEVWTTINASDYVSGVLNNTDTFVTGINGNNIVGCYITPDDIQHGFLYDITDPNSWTTVNVGALVTYPTGIDGSDIVGYYMSSPGQGFLYTIPEPGTIMMLVGAGLFLFFGALRRCWFKK